ncbi:MAG: hypothetical protein Q8P22_06835 [Chloroflexota bacterium]|nr:hypothetical protein [Chloroflexota bacterium]
MARQRGPRKPKEVISEVLRRTREGQPDSAIARDLRIHRTTVARYRAHAEGEVLGRMARLEVMKEALARHFQDLCQVAERLRKELSVPPPRHSAVDDLEAGGTHSARHRDGGAVVHWEAKEEEGLSLPGEDELLFNSLKQHTRDSELWELLGSWKKLGGQYLAELSRFWRVVKQESRGMTGLDIVSEKDKTGLTGDFPRVVYVDACEHAFSGGKGWEDTPYEVKSPRPGWFELWQGNVRLAAATTGEEVDRCANAHQELLRRYRAPEEGANALSRAVALLKELGGLNSTIFQELDRLLLRRTFPGKCDLCPG